jgi:hypothetical protein
MSYAFFCSFLQPPTNSVSIFARTSNKKKAVPVPDVPGGKGQGGGAVATHLGHRIAMAFLVMGLMAGLGALIDTDADNA